MNSCYKPIKPFQFQYEYQVEQFNREVEQYERCISDFIDEQNAAAKNHLKAAEDAIEEWNRFVKYEL